MTGYYWYILSQGLIQRIADMELGVGSADKAGQKRIYQQYRVMWPSPDQAAQQASSSRSGG